jgi:D-glycero-beta-D-manno-heptose 1-phosphate adenylyltransferase
MFYEKTKSKILSIDELVSLLQNWRNQQQRIVFTNGCFDLLHPGHIACLSQARDLGDKLLVGLNSDESVTRLKGENRPLQNENSRALVLAALEFVDAVVIFEEDTPLRLIELAGPDVLVKGGDWLLSEIIGSEFVIKNGGQVLTIPYLTGYSTTELEMKIRKF